MESILKTTRGELLRSAPMDAWVALSKDETRITASGATFTEVSNLLKEAGDEDSVILKTPKVWLPFTL